MAKIDWSTKAAGMSTNVEDIYSSIVEETWRVVVKHVLEKVKYTDKGKIPRDRKILMRKRTKIMKRLKCSVSKHNTKAMRDKIAKREKNLIESHRLEKRYSEGKAVEAIAINPKFFYKYAKKHTSIKARVGPLIDEGGRWSLTHSPWRKY